MNKKHLAIAQRTAFIVSAALLSVFVIAHAQSSILPAQDLKKFEQARQQNIASTSDSPSNNSNFNTSLWNDQRVSDYHDSLEHDLGLPEAVLEIPSIDLTVPIFTGIDELTLNRAVGRVPGTARIGVPGNLALYGHRDGFFRGLKDIQIGEIIEVKTLKGSVKYKIISTHVTTPDDLSVLSDTGKDEVTLVTCYPFYFVGSAPKRFIVKAQFHSEHSLLE